MEKGLADIKNTSKHNIRKNISCNRLHFCLCDVTFTGNHDTMIAEQTKILAHYRRAKAIDDNKELEVRAMRDVEPFPFHIDDKTLEIMQEDSRYMFHAKSFEEQGWNWKLYREVSGKIEAREKEANEKEEARKKEFSEKYGVDPKYVPFM